MYKGVAFKQGETWKDGCDLVCICENGTTGFYRCDDRWPASLQSDCYVISVLTMDHNYNYFHVLIRAQWFESFVIIQGHINPTHLSNCISQIDLNLFCPHFIFLVDLFQYCDSKWLFTCVSVNRCPVYQLTDGCTMEADPADSCCKKPVCHPEQMTPPTVAPTPSPKPGEVPSPTPPPTPYTLPMPTAVNYGSGPNGGRE
jgi:hypothetical protein